MTIAIEYTNELYTISHVSDDIDPCTFRVVVLLYYSAYNNVRLIVFLVNKCNKLNDI